MGFRYSSNSRWEQIWARLWSTLTPDRVRDYLGKGCAEGRVLGPFPLQAFPGFPLQAFPGFPLKAFPGFPLQAFPGFPLQAFPGFPLQAFPGFPLQAFPGVQVSRCYLDLSSPESASINDGINPDLCSLTYASMDDAARLVVEAGK